MPGITRTPAEVAARTGVTPTEASVTAAFGIITAEVGYDLATLDVTKFRARDVRLLTEAIDWQATYLNANPDVATREGNLTGASTNGNSLSWGDGGSAGGLLSPLAAMSLRRLSWRRSRSISLRRVKDAPLRPQTTVNDGLDSDWTPLR